MLKMLNDKKIQFPDRLRPEGGQMKNLFMLQLFTEELSSDVFKHYIRKYLLT